MIRLIFTARYPRASDESRVLRGEWIEPYLLRGRL